VEEEQKKKLTVRSAGRSLICSSGSAEELDLKESSECLCLCE